ncbi:beta-ketoacyl reductase, partial [Streptomyces sp. NPDC090127]|uniref:beta-ketoacyl reductase n=1 Tax=Streptomyces sp. NPDC090127 TaxID=3365953 RepID=UPI003829E0A3
TITALDTTDRTALTTTLNTIPTDHPLTTVIHAEDVVVRGDGRPERLDAARHLHELTREVGTVSAFVLLSTLAGSAGGFSHGLAHGYLEALAELRAAQGLPATSIAWGPWETTHTSDIGATAEGSDGPGAAPGFRPVSEEEGTVLFEAALRAGRTAVVAAPLDLAAVRGRSRTPELLRGLVPGSGHRRRHAAQAGAAAGDGGPGALAQRLARLSDEERQAHVLAAVRAEVAFVLGHADSSAIEPDRAFQELGFDSLTAVELRNRLNAMAGTGLPATLVFDHPTPAALADYVLKRVAPDDAAQQPVLAELARLEAAVIGLSAPSWGDLDQAAIAVRLQTLLAKVQETQDAAGGTEAEGAEDAESRIASATADEIFALIDSEFGTSQ